MKQDIKQPVASESMNGNDKTKQNKAETDQREDGKNKSGDSLLEKFFLSQLKDIYYAEKHIQKSLPKMEEAATSDELKEAFEDHLHQTTKQIKRLERIFEIMGEKPQAEKCEAIEGIIKECEKIINDTEKGTMTRDAALIIGSQKIEHYEIATYGGLVQLAITLGQKQAADLLDKTLIEEEDTDMLLTDIAEGCINIEAEEEQKFSSKKKNKENVSQ